MILPPKTNSESMDAKEKASLLKRRSFIRYAGFTAASTAIIMSGCKEVFEELPLPVDVDPEDFVVQTIYLDNDDTGVLNYAYTLEQLEAEFYTKVVASSMFASMFNYYEQRSLREIRDHEVVHREFYKAVLGAKASARVKFNFSSVNFNDRKSVLETAKTFEDLGVAAYNGAGKLFESRDLLMVAGKIVSVEARHASILRSFVSDDPKFFAGDDIINENALDLAFEPSKVLAAANPFIVNEIVSKL